MEVIEGKFNKDRNENQKIIITVTDLNNEELNVTKQLEVKRATYFGKIEGMPEYMAFWGEDSDVPIMLYAVRELISIEVFTEESSEEFNDQS
jgi:hypothetical protein